MIQVISIHGTFVLSTVVRFVFWSPPALVATTTGITQNSTAAGKLFESGRSPPLDFSVSGASGKLYSVERGLTLETHLKAPPSATAVPCTVLHGKTNRSMFDVFHNKQTFDHIMREVEIGPMCTSVFFWH